jgi:cytochrome P450
VVTQGHAWSAVYCAEIATTAAAVADLRNAPNGSVLSDLVNYRLTDGSQLSYAEIATHLMVDIVVGGSDTTTNAISEGILMLCRNTDQYALLEADLDHHLPNFVEESLRLETPVQGLYRVNKEDVEIRQVRIPAGSLINLRFAAGNRDADKFPCPEAFDIRRDNSSAHIAFDAA